MDWEQLEKDRKNGTPGPWVAKEKIYGWGNTPCLILPNESKPFANFIRPKSYYVEYPTVTNSDGEKCKILSREKAKKAGNYVPTKEHEEFIEKQQLSDARRCARVPDLEALALAGQELSEACEEMESAFSAFINSSYDPWEVSKWNDEVWENRKRMGLAWEKVRAALARWKEAGGEDE